VSPIIGLDTLDDAIRISNGMPFGLPSGVCTNLADAIVRSINELRAGRSTCGKCRVTGSG
jgi:acyl-CoA reductase-like NAD-dependent aldehyde dehydrogenase